MAKSIGAAEVKKMVVACEAGMGSSLMVTNQLKKKVKNANLPIQVAHTPARSIPQDAQIVFVHKGLAKLALEKAPWAVIIPFDNFMNIPAFDKVVTALQNNDEIKGIG
ncbi:MAG TPA: PTS lactose transporter subunit IIB [Anaerolineae bacterium]|nr:PTS lactose transporter subunit IIB [Anaerolineae bacterium]HMR62897.1 PTS lactose transporter subunit IIB [Anaerolineae bacterium]